MARVARRKAPPAPAPAPMPLPTGDLALQVIREASAVSIAKFSDQWGREYSAIVVDVNGVDVPLAILTDDVMLERLGLERVAVFVGWEAEN